MSKRLLIGAAAIITVIIAAALLIGTHSGWYLTLTDGDTGQIYARYPIKEGDSFAVGFVHSVNKNPVIDVYRIEAHQIFVEETIYYSFGAGVQTELNPGETLTYGEGGCMIVGNIHKGFDTVGLRYIVGSVSDHTLVLGDVLQGYQGLRNTIGVFSDQPDFTTEDGLRVISLGNLCGRHSVVSFTCEYRLF